MFKDFDHRLKRFRRRIPRRARRAVVGVVGGLVVLAGLVMVVTPGPAFVVVPAGLGLLATEFPVARLWSWRLKRSLRAWLLRPQLARVPIRLQRPFRLR